MTTSAGGPAAEHDAPAPEVSPPLWLSLLRLARPKQWVKSAFVAIGPVYRAADGHPVDWLATCAAIASFSLASSACYVVNDIKDREQDRAHPRKRRRPIAAGAVETSTAAWFAAMLLLASLALALRPGAPACWWLLLALGAYVLNVSWYSLSLKNVMVLDVVSLACGFVIRVLGGCAAAAVPPSEWLLNCVFFLSMFLAFGKRLGERRTLGGGVNSAEARSVQASYTDDMLRMVVVVTAVAALVTYAGYVQDRGPQFARGGGFNFLWLTMLPATYAMLRCIVLLERGDYDDPTELAAGDRPFQAAAAIFGLVTVAVWLIARGGIAGSVGGG
jgi:4-hydroxybenzoate polyprenyltransferase